MQPAAGESSTLSKMQTTPSVTLFEANGTNSGRRCTFMRTTAARSVYRHFQKKFWGDRAERYFCSVCDGNNKDASNGLIKVVTRWRGKMNLIFISRNEWKFLQISGTGSAFQEEKKKKLTSECLPEMRSKYKYEKREKVRHKVRPICAAALSWRVVPVGFPVASRSHCGRFSLSLFFSCSTSPPPRKVSGCSQATASSPRTEQSRSRRRLHSSERRGRSTEIFWSVIFTEIVLWRRWPWLVSMSCCGLDSE